MVADEGWQWGYPNQHGFTYQAQAVHRCIAAGLTGCPQFTKEVRTQHRPLPLASPFSAKAKGDGSCGVSGAQESIHVMDIIDEIARQVQEAP